jgi:hypothetical protein
MTTNRVMAILALITFIVFAGVMVYRVPRLDLSIVMIFGILLVVYDIATQLFVKRRR